MNNGNQLIKTKLIKTFYRLKLKFKILQKYYKTKSYESFYNIYLKVNYYYKNIYFN